MPRGGAAATEAAHRGPINAALKRESPGRRVLVVLEHNDPSGFRPSTARAAKVEERIKVLEVPERSPCLNICDFFLWSEVSRRMRAQEKIRSTQVGDEECVFRPRAPRSSQLALSRRVCCHRQREASVQKVDRRGRWQHRGGRASLRPHASPDMTQSRFQCADALAENPIAQNVLDHVESFRAAVA